MALSKPLCILAVLMLVGPATGCSEIRGRRHAREGNRLYESGNYAAAVAEYDEAERLRPGLPQVALNKGLACRQQLVPGGRGPEKERATTCALEAFQHLKQLSPADARADQLYVQTLFDGERFETLSTMYQKQLAEEPNSRAALDGLVQVYSRWDRPKDALGWIMKRADSAPKDATAQYAVGAFVWDLLFRKGGSGADKNGYDPRLNAPPPPPAKGKNKGKTPPPPPAPTQTRPLFSVNDIIGPLRVELADTGIRYLEKALALRPGYREALTYLNLLYRQKSFAYFDNAQAWQAAVDAAEGYRRKAMELDAAAAPAPVPPPAPGAAR